MKKTLIVTTYILLSLVVLYGTAAAQTSARFVNAHNIQSVMANTPADAEVAGAEVPSTTISTKVTSAFHKTFAGAEPKWYQVDNLYLARFTKEGTSTHALYRKNGYMLYSVTHGSEQLLPSAVRRMILSNYVDYKITDVTEAISLGVTAWIAHLKWEDRLVIVKVIDGEIVETTDYRNKSK